MYEFFPLGASPHTHKKDEVKISKAKKKISKRKIMIFTRVENK